jgi:SAM-dependent methyltransferase
MATEPAFWGLRRRVLDALDAAHLARPAVRTYEFALAARSWLPKNGKTSDDGLPLPPARLRAQVGPRHADAGFFLRSGRRHAELVRTLLATDGKTLEDVDALLDWGCGCGRILRHWHGLAGTRVAGCDINAEMIEWCIANLPFADVRTTELSPPLPYADSSFDLVYAFSVLTHLTEELQQQWARECLRVLRPSGYWLFSTLGEYYLERGRLNAEERERFAQGRLVVLYEASPGTSLCSAYHPPEYVRERLATAFDVVSFLPAGDDGRHDLYLLKKPAATA